jgi:hypothetical protein
MNLALERIAAALAKLNRTELLRRLLPGIPAETIRQRFRDIGLEATEGLVTLYKWRGGTRVEPGTPLDDVHFFPGYWFLSFDDALANYVTLRDDGRWDPAWFPVFANGGGDLYAVWIQDRAERVVGFLVDQPDHPVEYQNLQAMLETLADCFDDGVFFIDKRGYLEMNDVRHAEFARRHSPDVDLWRAP